MRVSSVGRSVGAGQQHRLEDEAMSADLLEMKRMLCPEPYSPVHGDLWWILGDV